MKVLTRHPRWGVYAVVRLGMASLACIVTSLAGQESTASGPKPESAGKERQLVMPLATDLLPGPVQVPRSYAVVIGINEYPGLPAPLQLSYAVNDAEAIYAALISPEGGNFRAENVHVLLGRDANLAGIRRELEQWLPSIAQEDDRVLVYFAGHGFMAGNRAYLAPSDYDPQKSTETGYAMEDLGKTIGTRIKAKWKVLLTDACHSGAIMPETDPQVLNGSLAKVEQSIFSLTASRGREASMERKDYGGGHGVFTYFVVKGLEGEADESCDGKVTADELAEYVRANVRAATRGEQTPTSDRGNFEPDMLLAYNATKVCSASRTPEFGTLIFVSNMDGVQLIVDGGTVGTLQKGQPLKLPGLKPGPHVIKAVKLGYEPDGPREETVFPGQRSTVSIHIQVRVHRKSAAVNEFEHGFELYQKGHEASYRKALASFARTLNLDPNYSSASVYLARTYSALFQPVEARKWFLRALDIAPDDTDARTAYAGLLLDLGDVDESIRQLTAVLRADALSSLAHCMLAQARLRKELYAPAIASAREAVRLSPADPEPHFWLAESLRLMPTGLDQRAHQYEEAEHEYEQYLRMSNFDSGLGGKLSYYVQGFLIGHGKKTRAAQQDIWNDLRSIAYAGLGDCERLLGRPDHAIPYYQRALYFDKNDPLVHFSLGVAYAQTAEHTQSPETLPVARRHFQTMIALNADLQESQRATAYVIKIDKLMAELRAETAESSRSRVDIRRTAPSR